MMTEEEDQLIEAYVLGTISEEQRIVVDQRIASDDRFRESVLLQKSIFSSFDESSWCTVKNFSPQQIVEYETILKNKETQKLKQTLQEANDSYNRKKKFKISSWKLYGPAAAVILLLLTFQIFSPSDKTMQELYASNYDQRDIPSLIVRGDTGREAEKAQLLFESGNFEEALPLFRDLSNNATSNVSTLLIYQGVSEMELGKYEDARATFQKLTRGNYLDSSKGLWYTMLLSMKEGNDVMARVYLEKILNSPTNYNYDRATKILEQL